MWRLNACRHISSTQIKPPRFEQWYWRNTASLLLFYSLLFKIYNGLTFPHFRQSLTVNKSEYSQTCRQRICLIRSIDTSNKIKKDVAICHTLALDYDIDQLGNWSTATRHNKLLKVSYWSALCLSIPLVGESPTIWGSEANSMCDEITLDIMAVF